MNRLRNFIGVLAFSLLVLSLPSIASAQWRNDRDRDDDDDYSRNDDYRNNRGGRNNRNLQSTVRNLKNRSQQFERRLDRELDNSRYNDRNREDRINRLAEDFAGAARNLDDEYDNRGDYNQSVDEAQRVLQLGNQLDRAVSRARLNGNIQNEWSRIRQDLDVLANAYNYNNNNRNNRNNRRNRQGSGDWRSKIPFPLPF
ncbi:MAG: gp58-like family protein [Pyrinomonadaceae bacterium]|nr:gp58-like family protein [Pyrinomonadaceae bacterium]